MPTERASATIRTLKSEDAASYILQVIASQVTAVAVGPVISGGSLRTVAMQLRTWATVLETIPITSDAEAKAASAREVLEARRA